MLIDRDTVIKVLVANSLATHFNVNKEDDYEIWYADWKKYMVEHIKSMILSLPIDK